MELEYYSINEWNWKLSTLAVIRNLRYKIVAFDNFTDSDLEMLERDVCGEIDEVFSDFSKEDINVDIGWSWIKENYSYIYKSWDVKEVLAQEVGELFLEYCGNYKKIFNLSGVELEKLKEIEKEVNVDNSTSNDLSDATFLKIRLKDDIVYDRIMSSKSGCKYQLLKNYLNVMAKGVNNYAYIAGVKMAEDGLEILCYIDIIEYILREFSDPALWRSHNVIMSYMVREIILRLLQDKS